MAIVIYADFSCPYSYLASLRADQLWPRASPGATAGVTPDNNGQGS